MKEKNAHAGHRNRMRNEIIVSGIHEGMPQHKILEYLLFYAIPRKDTNPIAHNLLDRFGSLSGVFDATKEELMKVEGIGESAATFIKMLIPIVRAYEADKISSNTKFTTIDQIGEYLVKLYLGYTEETVIMMSMNNVGKLLGVDIIGEGDISSVGISTRRVMEAAMRRHATSCVIAHNHPGGIALPSDDDLAVTVSIKSSLKEFGVRLIDHIIIANGDFVSLKLSQKYKELL